MLIRGNALYWSFCVTDLLNTINSGDRVLTAAVYFHEIYLILLLVAGSILKLTVFFSMADEVVSRCFHPTVIT